MMNGMLRADGAVGVTARDGLVGVTDLLAVPDGSGATLYVTTRGDGWVTAFDAGGAAGQTRQSDAWQVPSRFLQLETTDLALRSGAGGTGGKDELLLAGLRAGDLQALPLSGSGATAGFDSLRAYSASNFDMGQVSTLVMLDGQDSMLAASRSGGLVQATFRDNGTTAVAEVSLGDALSNLRIDGLAQATLGGTTYAFATFGAADAVISLSGPTGGALRVRDQLVVGEDTTTGWFDQPGALATATVEGRLFVITAASGSGSLTVLETRQSDGRLSVVDHVLDTRDTRFDDVSHIKVIQHDGATYVIAAGADQGIALLTLAPDGRLHHLDSIAGTARTPLDGISAIEAVVTGDDLRIWASTHSAPHLSEFSVDLSAQGVHLTAAQGGGQITGSGRADVLWGQGGNDQITGGSGADLLRDGGGQDRLTGGSGADVFVFEEDGVRDVITDFQSGVDRIDLSYLQGSFNLSLLQVQSQSWGAVLTYGDEVTEVRSDDGARLTAADFGQDAFVFDLHRVTPDLEQMPTGWQPPLGSNAGDLLVGSEADDMLDGLSGNDQLTGRGGRDELFGGPGNDIVVGGDDGDRIFGLDGDDIIYGDDADFSWV